MIFAAGDCNSIQGYDNFPPKAGVFAVREAEIIIKNINKTVESLRTEKIQKLIEFIPQGDFLKIINKCNGQAIAIKWGRAFIGKLAWMLKHKIDTNFMKQFK